MAELERAAACLIQGIESEILKESRSRLRAMPADP